MIDKKQITYDYYVSSFNGTLIPSKVAFDEAKDKAVIYLNYKLGTNVAKIDETIETDVFRDCICSLSERMNELANQYSSEGLGSWNVTYSDYANDPKLKEIMLSYLYPTGACNIWL